MDEGEFEDFFLAFGVGRVGQRESAGHEGAHLGRRAARAPQECWSTRSLVAKLTRRGVPDASWSSSSSFGKFRGNKRGVGHAEVAAAIVSAASTVNGHSIEVRPGDNGDAQTMVVTGPPMVSFSTDLLKSADYATLTELWETVAAAAKGPTIILEDGGQPGERARRAAADRAGAGQGGRHVPAVQGARRDERRAARRHHDERRDADAAQGDDGRRGGRGRDVHRAHGRRGRAPSRLSSSATPWTSPNLDI